MRKVLQDMTMMMKKMRSDMAQKILLRFLFIYLKEYLLLNLLEKKMDWQQLATIDGLKRN